MTAVYIIGGEPDYLAIMEYADSMGLKWLSGDNPLKYRPRLFYPYFIELGKLCIACSFENLLGREVSQIPTKEYL